MAIKANFIDNNVSYFASDLNRQFQNIVGADGLLREGKDFTVVPSSPVSLRVIVGAGSAYLNGIFIHSDSQVEIDLPRNDGAFDDRIDSIILKLNPVSGEVVLTEVVGEIGKAPELNPYELRICDVRISPSLDEEGLIITPDKITMTDKYVFISDSDIRDILSDI